MANRHIQTIYSSIFRKLPTINFDIEKFHLSDGDFLDCYWLKSDIQTPDRPIVVLFHGLAGSYESPYIKGMMIELKNAGLDSVVMHFRGCSGVDNALARSYHSGETGDAKEFLLSLKLRFPSSKLFCIGYSLGANMLLKLLGELKDNSLIHKAVAVSPPMVLDVCANRMNIGFSRYYQYRLVKDLNIALDKKYSKHKMSNYISLKRSEIKNLKTFWEFDEAYTAPIHGFESAQDYYDKSSSKQYLKYIKTPTLIIHSSDDPFMTQEVLPTEEELSKSINFELLCKGGHVGFISGTLFNPIYWLDKRISEYFKDS